MNVKNNNNDTFIEYADTLDLIHFNWVSTWSNSRELVFKRL